jgi:hypothetical protein
MWLDLCSATQCCLLLRLQGWLPATTLPRTHHQLKQRQAERLSALRPLAVPAFLASGFFHCLQQEV